MIIRTLQTEGKEIDLTLFVTAESREEAAIVKNTIRFLYEQVKQHTGKEIRIDADQTDSDRN